MRIGGGFIFARILGIFGKTFFFRGIIFETIKIGGHKVLTVSLHTLPLYDCKNIKNKNTNFSDRVRVTVSRVKWTNDDGCTLERSLSSEI
jgi:hypothetical protein